MTQLDFEDLLNADRYQTVAQLTRDIKSHLETGFPGVWVQGEISNLKHHSSGHLYFSLKDRAAQISCVMWRSRNQNLAFAPVDGMRILVKARLSVYEKRGSYQLDVWQIQPAGEGELRKAFEELKQKLYAEGLFAEQNKKPLPRFPERIGIVTSSSGAAIRDLKTVLRRRFPSIEIILFPVLVQGSAAATEIATAIREFNDFGQVDVIIVSRGGGSIEDLWAFNEESVARAIHHSNIPVVSAVGHEVDFCISDFVADVRAATPSAAAETVVCRKQEIVGQMQYFVENMAALQLENIRYEREHLKSIQRSYAFQRPADHITQIRQRLDDITEFLDKTLTRKLTQNQERVLNLERRLELLNHHKLLQRGYSVCFRQPDGLLVKRAGLLKTEDEIRVDFHEGSIRGKVNEVMETSAQ